MHVYIKKMVNRLILLLVCLAIVQTQNQTKLELNKIKNVKLQANQHQNFTLTISQQPASNQSLFISAESPYNDPFEEPYLSIRSGDSFFRRCDDEAASYTGICKIENKDMLVGREFVVEVYCLVDCSLKIAAYVSEMYNLGLGDAIEISSMETYGLAELAQINIPENATYSSILILAKLQSYETVTQGLTMVANYGPNATAPTKQNYLVKANPTYGHRLSIALTSPQVKPGQKIVLYLFLGINNTIQLSTYTLKNQLMSLKIGSPVIDFTTNGQVKKYVANLADYNDTDLQNKDIMVKFIVYSGTPDIKLSFDENFTSLTTQDNWYIDNSFVYLLTPAFRKQKNFTNQIFIKASSYFLASYYLELIINNKPFILLENNVVQLVKIVPEAIQNFIFEDQNYLDEIQQDGKVRYLAKIQMIEGGVEVGIRDCDSLMNTTDTNVVGCLIKDIAQLSDRAVRRTFDNVQGDMKKYLSTYEITFYYKVTTCPKVSAGSHLERYVCDFHFLLHNLKLMNSPPTEAYLGIQVTKFSVPIKLKEGVSTKSTVPQDRYNYYQFQLPSTDAIAKLQIYTTVIQGDIAILISNQKKYPDFNDLSGDVKMALMGNYVFQGDDIKNGSYYIGVYGYEITDFIISVAIQRVSSTPNASNETTVTEIQLQKGLSQTFTMSMHKDTMKFTINPTKTEQASIKISSISGTISYNIAQKTQSIPVQICDSESLARLSKTSCQFESKRYSTYLITVYGQLTEVQTFVISYSDAVSCGNYPINIPMYLEIRLAEDADGGDCFTYSLYELEDMEITVAMSDLDKIKAKGLITVFLDFKGSQQKLKMDEYQKVLTKTQLQKLCAKPNATDDSLGPDSSVKCYFQLQLVVNTTAYLQTKPVRNQSVQLMIAVQGFDDENVLFDGIPQKIVSQKLSTTLAKHFYYFVYDTSNASDLNIYLTSQSSSSYQIAARIVSDTTFGKDIKGLQYATYNNNMTDTQVVNSTTYSPITTLTIKKEKISRTSQTGSKVVLISIFGIPDQNNNSAFIFKLEATQKTTYLAYGDSKIGYVDKDSIYQYEIDVYDSIPSVLSVRPLGVEKCMASYVVVRQFVKEKVDQQGSYITSTVQFDKIKPFTSEKGSRKILVKGISDQMCTYQISFSSLNSPLKTILKGVPYEIRIETTQDTAYYLYNSNTDESLNIIQMINSGNSVLYILPIPQGSTDNIEQLLSKNIESFTWKGDLNANVRMQKTDPNYCRNCYYLIVVQGRNIVNGQLIVNLGSSPIPLKQGSILKDKLLQNKQNSYLFYSKSSFNITITPIYGRVTIRVTPPANTGGQIIKMQNISSTTTISVAAQSTDSSIDYFDDNARYIINVTAIKETNYFIEVKKKQKGTTLYEGMPINLDVGTSGLAVDFVNYQRENPINILIEDLNYYQDNSNQLTFEVSKINHQGYNDEPRSPVLIQNKTQSEGTYNLQLYSQSADYSLQIKTSRPTKISIILAKVSLTHLVATRTLMYTYPATFQVFSPGDSIMIEIFSCLGDIEVSASTNYTKIMNKDQDNVVRMEHANYGGHYVISAEDLKGEYFVQTKSLAPAGEKNKDLQYLISYYLYTQQEKMPYKVYGIANSYIQYYYKPGTIEYGLNKIHRKDNNNAIGEATYTLYISNNSESITKMTKCSLGNVYKIVTTESNANISAINSRDYVTFKINETQLKAIIGQSPFYYVGGEASFVWKSVKPHHVKSVYFVYDISQMVAGNQPDFKGPSKADNTFFILLWIVVPFTLGSFVFYLAVKYFINSIRQGPNQLVEEDDYGNSNQNFAGQSQSQSHGHANYDSSKQEPAHNPDKYSIE